MTTNLSPTQLSDLQKVNIRLKNLQDKILIEVKKLDWYRSLLSIF